MCDAVVIDSDGLMEPDPAICPPVVDSPEQFLAAVRESGLVGLGGAGFPSPQQAQRPWAKSTPSSSTPPSVSPMSPPTTGKPWRIPVSVLDGVYAVKKILGVERVLIAVENNKPDVIEILSKIAGGRPA